MQYPTEFKERHTAAAIFSQTMLVAILASLEGLPPTARGRRKGRPQGIAEVPQLFVAMVIRLNDERGLPPISQRAIARQLRTSHQNIGHWLEPLLTCSMIKHSGRGYTGNDGWMLERIDAQHFRRLVRALFLGGKKIERFQK